MNMNLELNAVTDDVFTILLDVYQAQNRDYTWQEFVDYFSIIINEQMKEWKNEEIE